MFSQMLSLSRCWKTEERADLKKKRVRISAEQQGKGKGWRRLEDKWSQIKEAHEKAVDAWTAECTQLFSCGTLEKDLPKCPKCLLKPKLTGITTSSQMQLEDLNGQTDDLTHR